MSRADRTIGGMAALWLGLVERRCLKLAADRVEPAICPADRVTLLDAALRSGDPTAYLDGRRRAFEDGGRHGDAVLSEVLRGLARAGEIETLMFMRSEWLGRHSAAQPRPSRST